MQMDAIFELYEESEVEKVWFLGDGRTQDWMALVYRDNTEAPWRATYRFRYYGDDPSPEAPDVKSVYAMHAPDGSEFHRDRLVEAMDMMAEFMAANMVGFTLHRETIHGSAADFLRTWSTQPFVHPRIIHGDSGKVH